MNTHHADRFIYVVGEHQCAIIPESGEILAFTRHKMQQIETGELATVVANVFAKGQFFPGPDGALTAVVHELAGRSEVYKSAATSPADTGRCTFLTVFNRLDGEVSVKVAAVVPVLPGTLNIEEPDGFHTLLVESLPAFQQVFTEEAYAADSKLIDIIKETTIYHITKKLH